MSDTATVGVVVSATSNEGRRVVVDATVNSSPGSPPTGKVMA